MKKDCEHCLKTYEAKRTTAKFCSPKCRLAAARALGVDPKTGEIVAGTKEAKKNPNYNPPVTLPPTKHPNPFHPSNRDPNYDREKNLKAFQKMGLVQVEWLSTGIPEFDELTRIPRGRITQIQGPYGVGKTTLCLNMIKGMKGRNMLYIDAEAALNPDLLADLDIENDSFTLYNESSYMEDIAEVIRDAAKSGKYDLIVLDSVPMTSTKTIAESEITASNIGQKAKVLHKLMGWITMDLKDTNTAMVFINQEREMIGTYVPTKYTPGGTAIPFQASLIVALKTIKSWRFPEKPKGGLYQGHEVEATIIKSKVNKPWRTKKFKLYYPDPLPQEEEKEAF